MSLLLLVNASGGQRTQRLPWDEVNQFTNYMKGAGSGKMGTGICLLLLLFFHWENEILVTGAGNRKQKKVGLVGVEVGFEQSVDWEDGIGGEFGLENKICSPPPHPSSRPSKKKKKKYFDLLN